MKNNLIIVIVLLLTSCNQSTQNGVNMNKLKTIYFEKQSLNIHRGDFTIVQLHTIPDRFEGILTEVDLSPQSTNPDSIEISGIGHLKYRVLAKGIGSGNVFVNLNDFTLKVNNNTQINVSSVK